LVLQVSQHLTEEAKEHLDAYWQRHCAGAAPNGGKL
jgi:hypothetical protein